MGMNGQFYSIIAVVIAVPVLVFITGTLVSMQDMKFSITEKIVSDQLYIVERSIEEDFHNGMEIATRRAIITMGDFIITNSTYFNETTKVYLNLLINGTIGGELQYLMINNTLTDWKSKILNISTGFDVDFNWTGPDGVFNGSYIIGDYGLTITVKDKFGISKIEKVNVRKDFLIDVRGLEDPTFAMGTSGLVRRDYQVYSHSFTAHKFNGTDPPGTHVYGNNNNLTGATGNATFDTDDTPNSDLILLNESFDNIETTGWGCVVAEGGSTPDPSQQRCYVTLKPEFSISDINDSINEMNHTTLFVDNITRSVWHLPVSTAIEDGHYFDAPGPNVFDRLDNTLASLDPQFVTFINAEEMEDVGIEMDYTKSHVAWVYFSGGEISGWTVRGFPNYFRAGNASASFLGFLELLNWD